jgi:hypothetical protein
MLIRLPCHKDTLQAPKRWHAHIRREPGKADRLNGVCRRAIVVCVDGAEAAPVGPDRVHAALNVDDVAAVTRRDPGAGQFGVVCEFGSGACGMGRLVRVCFGEWMAYRGTRRRGRRAARDGWGRTAPVVRV